MLKQALLALGVAALVAGCTTSNQVVKDEDQLYYQTKLALQFL